MPRFIHDRAEHLLAKNPEMPKSMAFALATQQSHALGKSPKSYGTKRGRQEAKAKYPTPKDDMKKANPGNLDSPKLAAMRAELAKLADLVPGGKADGKADKDFNKEQEAMGHKVEREHTDKPAVAAEITRDHLEEIPDYYTRLARMEASAPKRKEAMDPDHPYLLDQVGKPKLRNLSAMPPDKSLVVKKAAALSYHGLRTAIGAGTGLAAGAAMGAAAGGEGHRLRGALLGGAGGAAVGTAAGYAAPRYLKARAGTMNKATGQYAVNPATRTEALRHVGQSARQDIGDLAQGFGQRVQQRGSQMQQGVRKEQLDAARAAHAASLPAPAARVVDSAAVTGAASPMALHKAAAVKLAFTESMYSGGMGGGPPLTHTNYIPPFKDPPVKTAGPPPPDEKKSKMAAMTDELMKLNAMTTMPKPAIAHQAAQARRVGLPGQASKKLGPGIGDISKPVGFGSKSDVSATNQAKLGHAC